MDYKDSLLMPKTEFEMRGNLTQKEPNYQKRWADMHLYEAMQEKNKDKTPYVLHDGPPYANGNIHIGHAINRILKDMVWRTHFQLGYSSRFVPGWDTHGLPIETAITKLGHNRKTMSTADFRALCMTYAKEQIQTQMKDMKALGTLSDYDHYYATLQPEFEGAQIEVFGKMAMDGLIYKGLKPVYWSPSSESALAEAEIEYHDKKDSAIFVAFDVVVPQGPVHVGDRFVIWTTTPWTIPANLAVCLNADLDYVRVKTDQGILIVAAELADSLMLKFQLENTKVLTRFKGSEAEYAKVKHPFYERVSVVILGDHVSAEDGSGCVHTAPGHGDVDFVVGQAYNLEVLCPVDDKGCMTAEAGEFLVGQFVEEANTTVIEKLKELKALMALDVIVHSYPHDWRTKKPVIFRATNQWFASIDKIRGPLLREIDQVNWVPEWGKLRMHNMIKDRGDWCISRQRAWGVPIPIFYTEEGNPIMDANVFKHVAQLFRLEGSNVWFVKEAKELLPAGFTHPESPNGIFKKETDIMDVWFDSGSSHTGVILERGGQLPVDIYIEGSDQYRGWFNSSLIISTAVHGHAPYKTVVSHGFVLDGKGEKMSKSLGNTVEPNKVVSQYGADILRLWATSIDYQSDVRISDDLLKQVIESYKKIRNTFRFMLANLDGFDGRDLVTYPKLAPTDAYMMHKINQILELARSNYATYDYKTVVNACTTFMSNDLSAYYLDYTKDILYIEKKDGLKRRSVQTVLYTALDVLVKIFAPILVHTTEEIWDTIGQSKTSIHLELLPEVQSYPDIDFFVWDELFALRSEVFKALELARADKVIGKSLEAQVILSVNQKTQDLISTMIPDFAQWLIVSKVTVLSSKDTKIEVKLAEGSTCPRCWNVKKHSHEDGLCDRCYSVVHD